jgi:hypothetical protein
MGIVWIFDLKDINSCAFQKVDPGCVFIGVPENNAFDARLKDQLAAVLTR